ncbi:hypothetical protein TRIUR3_18148 [Triticum urartu]|uniref:Uncharacterized protein n=1 Tax=Triticum urartu TaxID=4572 RepID=M7Z3C7_TRIUA|nr:hypothetical protein TRIUR3_18148 [Triticum urartu]
MEALHEETPFDLSFHPSAPLVATSLITGELHMFRYADGLPLESCVLTYTFVASDRFLGHAQSVDNLLKLWDMEELLGGPQLNHQNDMPEANAAVHDDELPEANAAIHHDELPEANAAAGQHDELPAANAAAVNHNQPTEADSDDDGMDVDMEPSSSNVSRSKKKGKGKRLDGFAPDFFADL